MPAPTVFISYSHKDESWKDKLLPQLLALEQAGVAMQVWQDRKIDGGDKWYPEIEEAMANAAAAILLISADFLASPFCVKEEVPALLKRQETDGMLLIPVLLKPCPWRAHRWLRDRQMLPRDGKCVAVDFAGDHADTIFAAVAEEVLARFGPPTTIPPELLAAAGSLSIGGLMGGLLGALGPTAGIALPETSVVRTRGAEAEALPAESASRWPALSADRIDRTRLPETGSALFGRDEELELLDQAWLSQEQADKPPVRILGLIAQGGVGKSTLVNHWLAEMGRDNYRGAARVFGWSFYSQGVREQTAASADSFIDAALRFFGDPDPTLGSPWDKGARLAHLVGDSRALLVLDGLEPVQSANKFERGKLRDPALESLLRGLARRSTGLCIVTTREPLIDLSGRPGVSVRDLEQISPQAGRALLRVARVVGTDAELETLASRFGPHALAVSLLGVYLREQPGHGIEPARALEELPGREPINRVLAGFENWLGDSPEREALRLLGFFDRPADAGCLAALRSAPVIHGSTDHIVGLSEVEWSRIVSRLETLRLVHTLQSTSGERSVDAHPLIREHFSEVLQSGDAWREGHRRLYEHLCATTEEGDEPTLEELQPLYQAVAHGCRAGLQQQALDQVYFARIQRRKKDYSTRALGAFGTDLAAVACFFEIPWSRVLPDLTEGDRSWLLHRAAHHLRALARPAEALDPMRVSREMDLQSEQWENASISFRNLSELELTLGDVARAVLDAERAEACAERSGSWQERVKRLTCYADALHQAGRRAEAEAHFRQAEQMQAKRQTKRRPEYRLLHSLRSVQYCDLLLAEAERAAWRLQMGGADGVAGRTAAIVACREAERRSALAIKIAERSRRLLDIALHHLTMNRAALYRSISQDADFRLLASYLPQIDRTMHGLRAAGQLQHLPPGFLTRAWVRMRTDAHANAANAMGDLDEAWEIAERGPMPLFMADIHLHRARLFFREPKYPWNRNPEGTPRGPKDDLAAARAIIERCGYRRRKEELEDAEAVINEAIRQSPD